jgi:NAD(P)-binding Rossmann-like domain/Flavin containing amine oxidoreductase
LAQFEGKMPEVTIVGAGLAGMSAATRLMEQGFDITLYEQSDFLGGKLGTHRENGKPDPHEHCYHMYLNWYNNFWQLMREIGAIGKFIPSPVIGYRKPGDKKTRPGLTNAGSPWTILDNMFSGVAPPADQFISAYSLLDLIGPQAVSTEILEQTSVSNFFRSRLYGTEASLVAASRTLAEAFASPSYLSSARSYQSLIKYGYRNPAPALWLLTQNTNDAIFEPWEKRLETRAAELGRKFKIQRRVRVEQLHLSDGEVRELTIATMPSNPTTERGVQIESTKPRKIKVSGDLLLTVPPGALGRLVSPEVAAHARKLEQVRLLRSEPMISLDLYFKCQIPGLTKSITVLQDSNYALSLLDNSQVWNNQPGDTALNVISSNADLICDYPNDVILDIVLKELQRFLDFRLDQVDYDRCHIQTNVGEELFVNQVGSWDYRPTATCDIPNLFLAGDFCQTFIDVVTIEGAVVSGLVAAEALRSKRGIGAPIAIVRPDSYPAIVPAMLAVALLPAVVAAKAFSMADSMFRGIANTRSSSSSPPPNPKP